MEMKGQVNTKGELSAIKYIFMVANELGMVINRPGLFNGNRRIKSDIPSVEILECILNAYTCRGVVSYIPVSIEYDIDTTAKKGYVNLSSVITDEYRYPQHRNGKTESINMQIDMSHVNNIQVIDIVCDGIRVMTLSTMLHSLQITDEMLAEANKYELIKCVDREVK